MGGLRAVGLLFVFAALASGCASLADAHKAPVDVGVPYEREKAILPEYVIEPPDLLQIDLLYAVPRPPYKIQPLDVISLTVTGTPDEEPISGLYPVEPDGTISLGGRYRSVRVAGLSAGDAKAAVQKHLEGVLKVPRVQNLSVAEGRGVQQVRGQHLVRPDGTVSLGSYGSVVVTGRTVQEVKALIEGQLRQSLVDPEVIVSVIGYNSKLYYIVFDFGGAGQQLIRMPVTGNDTVLDALSQVNGLTTVSDPNGIWVARSAGPGEPDRILPVDWAAVTCRGRSESNYQLVPNDRIYVRAYTMTRVDVTLARVLSPIERLLGATLLGTTTYRELRFLRDGGTTGGVTTGR
jgi:polysaccharide export outer membrane protein